MSVLLETSMGDLVIDLCCEKVPKATLNFLKLCKVKYYNFCEFHRVEKGFMVQAGDPTGTGKGGVSIFGLLGGEPYFADELDETLTFGKKGTVGMVKAGAVMNGSQFFITLADNLDWLDGKYTVIGSVAEGLEVLEQIGAVMVDENKRPFKDVRVKHTYVLDDPFEDPAGLQVPDASPEPTAEQLQSMRLVDDGEGEDEWKNLNDAEREEKLEMMEAQQRALTLELLGDLPSADIKPPENVLFICKLNPVTRDEDLHLIFSRFGKIHKCEIVRDKESGQSLQYAFVEYEEKEACEEAYFKMNDMLIDDRRIKVDFSQSVAKLHQGWVEERRKGILGRSGEDARLQIKEKYLAVHEDNLVFDARRERRSREAERNGRKWRNESREQSPEREKRKQTPETEYRKISLDRNRREERDEKGYRREKSKERYRRRNSSDERREKSRERYRRKRSSSDERSRERNNYYKRSDRDDSKIRNSRY